MQSRKGLATKLERTWSASIIASIFIRESARFHRFRS